MTPIRNRLILALAALCVAASTSRAQDRPAAPGQTSRTWVVAVGISKYQRLPGGQQLQFADRDATAFADALRNTGTSGENIRALIGADATAFAIKAALGNWLARSASDSDTVILFFSGHGIFEREFGESYLLANDSDPQDPYTSALSVTEISQVLRSRVRARRVLILVDAVRRDFFDPEAAAATSFVQAFNQLAASRAGTAVMIASGPGEFSREGQRWSGHGVFTRHLIDALTSKADRNGDGLIAADELLDVVKARVAEDTSGKQQPWRSQVSVPEIIVARIEPPAIQPAATAASRQSAKPTSTQVARDQSTDKGAKPHKDAGAAEPRPEAAARPTDRAPQPAPSTSPSTPEMRSEPSTPLRTSAPPPRSSPPPVTRTVNVPAEDQAPLDSRGEVAIANPPPPPRPVTSLPNVTLVASEPVKSQPTDVASSVPVSSTEAAPSPLVLQIEAAIVAKNLIEPKNASAWDFYQRLSSEPGGAAQAERLKPMVVGALVDAGRGIVAGDVRVDNISDLVDDFRRAGQMFVRARSLAGQDAELGALEKLSAAEALIALQFYDEAEQALGQLQAVKLAAIENALGLVYQGKLDTFRAERAFKRAIELNSKWAAPRYNLALLYRSQQNEQALTELEGAATIDPSNASVLIALGDECFARQQWQRAMEAFRKAIALRPSDDALHTKLGHALYSQGLTNEADREYQRARELRGKP